MDSTNFFAIKNEIANQFVNGLSNTWGISIAAVFFLIAVVVVWELVWKLIAMWKAARNNSSIWFVVLAVLNTLGILPILYIFIFSKMKRREKPSIAIPKRRRR